MMMLSFAVLLSLPLLVLSVTVPASDLQRRALAFADPAKGGGSQLDDAGNGLGEPLNVIISGLSSPKVLTDDGILNWARSVNFSTECLGIHLGAPQQANLGDGNGAVNQTLEIRQDFGNANLGTCLESLEGGNHFRYWRQNGTMANTGALFLAVSQEENVAESHTIAPNGYDVGRLVAAATASQTSFGGVNYSTTNQTITGLLPVGSQGVNHGIALDGNVVLLTITIV
ncbi:hypothetical protein M422DRAFT_60668 [Sphaerobolus stellatus SS14]|uniref:Unplaced genomic scaffold SPHSTscaffold_73, whole genome shotgun sequence n=1 Tax=Sphaerobolus stellatus (strain SS14) TaxID=990650 RepID=A0A0C9VQ17_SPHS4|nr:hypothetical protein M422DRAFT_60668 [Sphaerobolus stellatus SS14]